MAPEVRSTHSSSPDIVSAALNLGELGLGYLGISRRWSWMPTRLPHRWMRHDETLCFANVGTIGTKHSFFRQNEELPGGENNTLKKGSQLPQLPSFCWASTVKVTANQDFALAELPWLWPHFSIVFLFGLWSQWHGPAILLRSACCWSWPSLVEASLGWAHPLGEALEDPAWGDWLSRSGPATNRRLDGPSL